MSAEQPLDPSVNQPLQPAAVEQERAAQAHHASLGNRIARGVLKALPAGLATLVGVDAAAIAAAPPAAAAEGTPLIIERKADDNRYGTASAVNAAVRPGADSVDRVFVASGEKPWDAFAATPAAAKGDDALILTQHGSLPAESAREFDRVAGPNTEVVIVGGTAAISPAVEAQLDARTNGPVVRAAGNDRYETAAIVTGRYIGTNPSEMVVADATTDFVPPLVAAHVAAADSAGLLLTNGNTVPAPTRNALNNAPNAHIVAVGSGAANALTNEDEVIPGGSAEQLSMSDARRNPSHRQSGEVVIATKRNHADALGAGLLAAERNASLIVTDGTMDEEQAYLDGEMNSIRKVTITGGTAAIPTSYETSLRALNGESVEQQMPMNITPETVRSVSNCNSGGIQELDAAIMEVSNPYTMDIRNARTTVYPSWDLNKIVVQTGFPESKAGKPGEVGVRRFMGNFNRNNGYQNGGRFYLITEAQRHDNGQVLPKNVWAFDVPSCVGVTRETMDAMKYTYLGNTTGDVRAFIQANS